MKENTSQKSSLISMEKLLLASIPVIGSIIVAVISHIGGRPDPPSKPVPALTSLQLKSMAGKIDDMVMFGNYNDLYPLLSEGLKPAIPHELFDRVNDSMRGLVGHFVRSIDTTQSKVNGMDVFYVKNQHQNGQSLVSIAFDDNGKAVHLLYGRIPGQ